MKRILCAAVVPLLLGGCGNLDKKTAMIGPGDTKDQVVSVMGPPDDRQFKGSQEAWQYCKSGAGVAPMFGYNDFRIIWIDQGKVSGITSNKSSRPGNCMTEIKSIRWEEAPTASIEIRNR